MKRRWFSLALVALVLVGCADYIPKAQPLTPQTTTALQTSADVAITSDGLRHYVWSECDSNSCSVIYTRMRAFSEITRRVLQTSAQDAYTSPQVELTNNGDAHVVFRTTPSITQAVTQSLFYVHVPYTVTASLPVVTITNALADTNKRMITAGGDTAYVVYRTNTNTLYYRRVAPILLPDVFVVNPGPVGDESYSDPAIGVDPNNYLHAAYVSSLTSQIKQPSSTGIELRYTTALNGTSVVKNIRSLTSSAASLDLDSSTYETFVAYAIPTSMVPKPADADVSPIYNNIFRYSSLSNSSTPITADSDEWIIHGDIDLDISYGSRNVTFAGTNKTLPNRQEIWIARDNSINKITDTPDYNEINPQVQQVFINYVILWQAISASNPADCLVISSYWTDYANRGVTQLAGDGNNCIRQTRLVENNGWLSGVYSGVGDGGLGRFFTTYNFDAKFVYLPLVQR